MLYRSLVLILLLFPMLASADPEQLLPRESYDIIKYQTPDGAMLVKADVDWSRYSRVQVKKGTVEFKENWVRDQENLRGNIIREADLERTKEDMADLLDKVLRQNLSEREEFTITDESGADVLQFTASITKLDIYTPDFARNFVGHELTGQDGSMVIVLDINDSVSGKMLASSVQKLKTAELGYFEHTSRGSNKTAFRRMMNRWSDWFFAMLEKVRAGEMS